MGSVEDDVNKKADEFLGELFGEEGLEEEKRLALVRWMSSHVQQERQGWKKKIQMAFKEVEKERKLALDVHAKIHVINNKFEPYLCNIYMFREASMYYASDKDSKVNHIDQLEKNLNALLDMINCYQEERIQCFQYLKVADNSANLTDVLSKRIARLEDQTKRVDSEAKETEARLEKEIKNLTETLDLKIQLTKEENEKSDKKIRELQKTIKELRIKCREMPKQGLSPIPSSTHAQENGTAVSPLSFRKSVSNISVPHPNIDASTQTVRATRDCCIQVSIGLTEPPKNTIKSPSKEKVLKQAQSQDKLNIAQDIDITDLKPLPPPGTTTYPITSITIVKKKADPRSMDDVIDANNAAIKKFASSSLTNLSEAGQSTASRFDTSITGHARTVEFLRGQISHLVNSLEQVKGRLDHSKQEAEKYRQQLATVRARAVQRDMFNRAINDSPSTYRSLNDGSPSEGKLMGVKVNESPRFSYTQHTPANKNKSNKANFFHGMAKCLRCNKVYRLSENNPHACRYHPKTRKQIEKYDAMGRLVKVSHMWECCRQGGDATGCRIGEHV